jgi:hypothetical protein
MITEAFQVILKYVAPGQEDIVSLEDLKFVLEMSVLHVFILHQF